MQQRLLRPGTVFPEGSFPRSSAQRAGRGGARRALAFRPSGRCLVRCWAAQPKRAAEGSRRQRPLAPEGRRQAGLLPGGGKRFGLHPPRGCSRGLVPLANRPAREAPGSSTVPVPVPAKGLGAGCCSQSSVKARTQHRACLCPGLCGASAALPALGANRGGIPSARAVLSSAPPRFATPRNGHQTVS